MGDEKHDALKPHQFDQFYKEKKAPWDLGRPDFNLVDLVTKRPILAGRALDIGCGSGHNAVWLAQQGFTVTGLDVAPTALETAQANAAQAGVACTFLPLVFFKDDLPGTPYDFLFDRGCWHLLPEEDREPFARKAAASLADDGLWFSISGSADEPLRGSGPLSGPPRRSARDIVLAVEPHFEILSLTATRFDSNHPKPPQAWACLMKKRKGK